MSLGIEFPLDNDLSLAGEIKRKEDDRPFGVPDISNHLQYVQLQKTLTQIRAYHSA
ncbi:hypothetical protein ACJRPK_06135 [Aquimarina sp. 2-A2]|uniref:hypothetical protein n=1 Tax=Aquimarina sp. 2-A2 TaxID=3382644 RepID=UPI00387F05B1